MELKKKIHETENTVVRSEMMDRRVVLDSKKRYWYLRRAQDIFFSGLALIMLSPIMLLTALAVYIDSPGASPIFVQDRVGRDGKVFRFMNLRWMKSWCMAHKEIERISGFICTI